MSHAGTSGCWDCEYIYIYVCVCGCGCVEYHIVSHAGVAGIVHVCVCVGTLRGGIVLPPQYPNTLPPYAIPPPSPHTPPHATQASSGGCIKLVGSNVTFTGIEFQRNKCVYVGLVLVRRSVCLSLPLLWGWVGVLFYHACGWLWMDRSIHRAIYASSIFCPCLSFCLRAHPHPQSSQPTNQLTRPLPHHLTQVQEHGRGLRCLPLQHHHRGVSGAGGVLPACPPVYSYACRCGVRPPYLSIHALMPALLPLPGFCLSLCVCVCGNVCVCVCIHTHADSDVLASTTHTCIHSHLPPPI